METINDGTRRLNFRWPIVSGYTETCARNLILFQTRKAQCLFHPTIHGLEHTIVTNGFMVGGPAFSKAQSAACFINDESMSFGGTKVGAKEVGHRYTLIKRRRFNAPFPVWISPRIGANALGAFLACRRALPALCLLLAPEDVLVKPGMPLRGRHERRPRLSTIRTLSRLRSNQSMRRAMVP